MELGRLRPQTTAPLMTAQMPHLRGETTTQMGNRTKIGRTLALKKKKRNEDKRAELEVRTPQAKLRKSTKFRQR